MPKSNRQKQRDYIAAQKAKGLKRLVLWVQPEDVDTLRAATRQPHIMAELERRVRDEIIPEIRDQVERELLLRQRRAILAQKRAQVRRLQAGSNRLPELIRFAKRPPGDVRNRLKASGWIYDPVRAVWILPDDPETWPDTERLLNDLERYDIERLAEPLD